MLTAMETKKKIEEYFAEQDENHKPYTRAGIARKLGITTKQLMRALETDNEYARIFTAAFTRIEEMAEEKLYNKSSSAGSKYVLSNVFGWSEKKEVKQDTEVVVKWDWGLDGNSEKVEDEKKEV